MTTIYRTTHMCLSVRGALKTMTKKQLVSMFDHDGGRRMTADEARDALLDELAKGHEVIPFGKACEGFDYSGGGCPGHLRPSESLERECCGTFYGSEHRSTCSEYK